MSRNRIGPVLALCALLGLASLAAADQTVILRLRDQNGQEIPGSVIRVLGQEVATGSSIDLPVGAHAFELVPGLLGVQIPSRDLKRAAPAEVDATTREIAFEWRTSRVAIRLHDQNGVDIPGSVLLFPQSVQVANGTVGDLAITDESVYPTMSGGFIDGYPIGLVPGLLGVQIPSRDLKRGATVEVVDGMSEIAFEWRTSRVVIRLHDQNGVDIPGSVLLFPQSVQVANGTVAFVAITDESVYPTMSGGFIDGYPIGLVPGLLGVQIPSRDLKRGATVEVVDGMSEIAFEWITANVTIRLHDQNDIDIPGSVLMFPQNMQVANGTVGALAITDESVYQSMSGGFTDGYPIGLVPGLAGTQLASRDLSRAVKGEVAEATAQLAFEWIQFTCPMQLRDAEDAVVPDSSIGVPREATTLPVNDSATYASITGDYSAGYPIVVTPGDIPPTSATIDLTVLASGEFSPATFEIGGNTYQLACGSPPTVSATGGGVFELGPSSVVTLGGQVSDADGDLLTYEWRLDGDALFPADTIQAPANGDPVALPPKTIGTQTLGVGVYTIELAVSDGASEVVVEIGVEVTAAVTPVLMPTTSDSILWPVDGKMHKVTIQANASEAVTLAVEISSDEPVDGTGDGSTEPDSEVLSVDQTTGQICINLRAERAGNGEGRTYTVTITATDAAGNTSMAVVTFVVPHSQGGN